MELRDIKNLDQLNSILNETVERGVNNAAQAKWGGRDFILTDENGTQTTVKMKDLVNKFRELANEKGADKDKINDITKNIIKLDFGGDVKLEKYGEMSKRIRNLKNLITPSHLDVIDAISEKHLFKNKDVQQRLIEIITKAKDPQKEFILNNFDENTKSALRLLFNDDYNSALPIVGALRNNERLEVKDFIESLDQEWRAKSIRDNAIESGVDILKRTDARVDLLIENFAKNSENFAEKYFTSAFREGGGFHIDYKRDLEALVHRDPAKAYPIIRALATHSVPEGLDIKEVKAFSGDRKDVKDLCQGLMKQCEKYIIQRSVIGNTEISLNSRGAWQMGSSIAGNLENIETVLGVPTNQLTPLLFNHLLKVNDDKLASLKDQSGLNISRDTKTKIIEGKNIIAKAIEDETIADDELKALFKGNKIDLKSDYFFTDKNDPKDRPDLIKLMRTFRPDVLKEMQPKLDRREVEELKNDLVEVVVFGLSAKSAQRLKKSSAYSDVINLNKALKDYGSSDDPTKTIKIIQDMIAGNSHIREEIQRLQSKDSQEDEKKLGEVLSRIVKSFETLPG